MPLGLLESPSLQSFFDNFPSCFDRFDNFCPSRGFDSSISLLGFESRGLGSRVLRFLGEDEEEEDGLGFFFPVAAARALDMRASKAEGREEDMGPGLGFTGRSGLSLRGKNRQGRRVGGSLVKVKRARTGDRRVWVKQHDDRGQIINSHNRENEREREKERWW